MTILSIHGVRSYQGEKPVEFDLSKYVTLIYGQNGSGKSTVSGYFYKHGRAEYSQCNLQPPLSMNYLVFNQEYVDDIFSQPSQPGIFTLSSENAEIKTEIDILEAQCKHLRTDSDALDVQKRDVESMSERVKSESAKQIYSSTAEIRKTDLWDLMAGTKQTDKLYQTILEHTEVEDTSTQELVEELHQLEASKGNPYALLESLPAFPLNETDITLLMQPLIPTGDSRLAAAINQLGNIDWVRNGQSWLIDDICPFCQTPIDAQQLQREITALFDTSWEAAMEQLQELQERYQSWYDKPEDMRQLIKACPLVEKEHPVYLYLLELEQVYQRNKLHIDEKLTSPSISISLEDLSVLADAVSAQLTDINTIIGEHNRKADNYHVERSRLKQKLLGYIRKLVTETITNHDKKLAEFAKKLDKLTERQKEISDNLNALTLIIRDKSSLIVNTQETIDRINCSLNSLGVTGFHIAPYEDRDDYRLIREGENSDTPVFSSLSEGEKTLIAFLYFLETCTGRKSRDDNDQRTRLIVIDDPISSLSQNYVFEIASLIQYHVIRARIAEKIIILTHSLFFFQELLLSAERKKRPAGSCPPEWTLYRISKSLHSSASPVSEKELLNDYQALWYVLRHAQKNDIASVVIPNTMRQILEYYFGFSGKSATLHRALETLSSGPEGEPGFRIFARYLNRHSHQDARNISLHEGASVERYLTWFKKVFEAAKDEEHYTSMMGEVTKSA
ncbi:AAA family ATPase [Providencia rettgeri]|uniref:AAA family ATPase n=1 Tax=Providencia rettgeri TaxID=587 RepID=UPI001B37681A|nr:AAA family ATPase [Providencia rettgeri]MBQ0366381.1 AAA family ATPase [Providencia rettgeri]